jgi:3-deoxy-D-manno-octulosonic-acid transferase
LFTYYASADICLVGGSLLPYGGQNLIEAMRMGKPVLIGEHTYNFKEVSVLALAQEAALLVKDAAEIRQTIETLLENPEKQAEMGAAGLAICMASLGATEKTLSLIAKNLK